jgi:predicted aspartyl protease
MAVLHSMKSTAFLPLGLTLALAVPPASGEPETTRIPMREKGSATFYVTANIGGVGDTELLVDTGSAFVAISETTLAALKRAGNARYVRTLQGVMADGRERVVPVYAITGLTIGGACTLGDVEAAVFSGTTRQILGLSGLRKVAPFMVSLDPPSLLLSNCGSASAEAASAGRVQLSIVD